MRNGNVCAIRCSDESGPVTKQENILDACEYVDDFFLYSPPIKIRLAAIAEGDEARNHGVERVVLSYLYILSRFNFGTALAYDYHAWASCLAIRKLNSEVLRS